MSDFIPHQSLNGWSETGGVISPGLFRSATPRRSCLPANSVGSSRSGSARPGRCASPHKTGADPPDLAVVEGTVFPSALAAGGFSPVDAGRVPARTGPRRYRIRPCRVWSPGRGRRPRVVDVFTSGTHVTFLRPLQNKQSLPRKRASGDSPLISTHSIGRRPKRKTVG